MEQENTSFWTEIKRFEDTLSKDPDSICFAPLAELYRRVGMLDDAISVAENGTDKHPEYVGGYLVLGRAYSDKGMITQAREVLEKVIRVTPDNLLALRYLSTIYIDAGENDLARKSLEALLAANPTDTESRILLESLERTSGREAEATAETDAVSEKSQSMQKYYQVELHPGDDEDELVEIELVDELDEFEEEDTDSIHFEGVDRLSDFQRSAEVPQSVGIRTATLAELYVAQGHLNQALEVYRDLIKHEPENSEYTIRLAGLESSINQTPEYSIEEPPIDPWQLEDIPVETDLTLTLQEDKPSTIFSDENNSYDEGDDLIKSLEGFLENIRRVRECRSEIL